MTLLLKENTEAVLQAKEINAFCTN